MTVKSVVANLPFIADLPLYSAEKPYTVIPLAGSSTPSAGNVEITQRQVQVGDLRHLGFTLGKNGVQVVNHESKYLDAWDHAAVKAYKKETEAVLREVIPDAEYVLTWDFRVWTCFFISPGLTDNLIRDERMKSPDQILSI